MIKTIAQPSFLLFGLFFLTYLLTMPLHVFDDNHAHFVNAVAHLQPSSGIGPFPMLLYQWVLFPFEGSNLPVAANVFTCFLATLALVLFFKSLTHFLADTLQTTRLALLKLSAFVAVLFLGFSETYWGLAHQANVFPLVFLLAFGLIFLSFRLAKASNKATRMRLGLLLVLGFGFGAATHFLVLWVLPIVLLILFNAFYRKHLALQIMAVFSGFLGIGLIYLLFFQLLPKFALAADIWMVNELGTSFWTGFFWGLCLFFALLMAIFVYFKQKNDHRMALFFLYLLLFSLPLWTYALMPIRSLAEPDVNHNRSSEPTHFLAFLGENIWHANFEWKGALFDAKAVAYKSEGKVHYQKEDKYVAVAEKARPQYRPKDLVFFPILTGTSEEEVATYQNFLGFTPQENPTSADNWRFYRKFQMGYFYGRFLAWNFIGRQNGQEGNHRDFRYGGWQSGISFLDQKWGNMCTEADFPRVFKDEKTTVLYGLPLFWVLMGFLFLAWKNRKVFSVLLFAALLFSFVLVLYLNPQPHQSESLPPFFVPSYFVFATFMAFGFAGFLHFLAKIPLNQKVLLVLGTVLMLGTTSALSVPQSWKGHQKTDNRTMRDMGYNLLASCDRNGILFVTDEAERRLLQYLQQVEGVRQDVAVVDLPALNHYWYIENIRQKEQGWIGLPQFGLLPGKRDFLLFKQDVRGFGKEDYHKIDLFFDYIGLEQGNQKGRSTTYFPTQKLDIPVNKLHLLNRKAVSGRHARRILPIIRFDLPKEHLLKSEFLMLEIIRQNAFERPIHFSSSVPKSSFLGLEDYLRIDGLVYTLLPIIKHDHEQDPQIGWIDERLLDNHVKAYYRWGNLAEKPFYLTPSMRQYIRQVQSMTSRLAEVHVQNGNFKNARQVVDLVLRKMPPENIGYDFFLIYLIDVYYLTGKPDAGLPHAQELAEVLAEELDYYTQLETADLEVVQKEIRAHLFALKMLLKSAAKSGQNAWATALKEKIEQFNQ